MPDAAQTNLPWDTPRATTTTDGYDNDDDDDDDDTTTGKPNQRGSDCAKLAVC